MNPSDRQLLQRIAERLEVIPQLPASATIAAFSRHSGSTRGWFTGKEFAAVIGRSDSYVASRCKAGVIKTLPGGKPYRIPLSEEAAWNQAQTSADFGLRIAK